MGLDIAFNRKQAIEAGLEVIMHRNGDDEQINDARLSEWFDAEYVQWLESSSECIKVPYSDHYVGNDGVDEIIVRANKWGRTYAPLTQWLTENGIVWSEF